MKTLGIDGLSVEDRLALAQEIWESVATDADLLPLTEEQKHVFDRRLAELNANPQNVSTWEQIKRHVTVVCLR